MVEKIEIHSKNDLILWCSFLFVISAGVIGYYAFSQYMVLFRVICILITSVVSMFILLKTTFGKKMEYYWNDAVVELRKVVWPTKKQTIQSTLAVLSMVFVMGILLWIVDAILIKIIAKIIG